MTAWPDTWCLAFGHKLNTIRSGLSPGPLDNGSDPLANLISLLTQAHSTHRGNKSKFLNQLWFLLYRSESSGVPWRGREGRRAPENPLRIINISSLSTFLRITFVLLCPVPADRAVSISSISPPFSPLCWEQSLSKATLAIRFPAIVSMEGKN